MRYKPSSPLGNQHATLLPFLSPRSEGRGRGHTELSKSTRVAGSGAVCCWGVLNKNQLWRKKKKVLFLCRLQAGICVLGDEKTTISASREDQAYRMLAFCENNGLSARKKIYKIKEAVGSDIFHCWRELHVSQHRHCPKTCSSSKPEMKNCPGLKISWLSAQPLLFCAPGFEIKQALIKQHFICFESFVPATHNLPLVWETGQKPWQRARPEPGPAPRRLVQGLHALRQREPGTERQRRARS